MSATVTGSDDDGHSHMRREGKVSWDSLALDEERSRRWKRLIWSGAIFGVVAASLSAYFAVNLSDVADDNKGINDSGASFESVDLTPLVWVVSVGILSVSIAGVLFLITRRQYMKNQNEGFSAALKAQEEYHREALEKLRKTTELATLMELNQGQIGTYHRIVTEQADKAFKSSRVAMGVGLFLLVCAAVAGAYVPVEQVRWFIGALAAFSTVLSGYLTRTYLAMYKESIGQLNRYFDQPVLNSHYLTAERLIEGLDGEAATEVRRQIIDEVLAASANVGSMRNDPARKASLSSGKSKKRKVPKQQSRTVAADRQL
ncbi:hypothetical protein U9R90_26740 [Streptomyces sp. E11-3]|uniref:hypothetical protein n=1 Tax=Streptomyces sp. E11-3 TaxID=3110112 RepID=UPI003980D4E7